MYFKSINKELKVKFLLKETMIKIMIYIDEEKLKIAFCSFSIKTFTVIHQSVYYEENSTTESAHVLEEIDLMFNEKLLNIMNACLNGCKKSITIRPFHEMAENIELIYKEINGGKNEN